MMNWQQFAKSLIKSSGENINIYMQKENSAENNENKVSSDDKK